MSTDYSIACTNCGEVRHLGQRFASGWAFGYGSFDSPTHEKIGEWIQQHIAQNHELRVYWSDDPALDYFRKAVDDL